MEILRLNNIGEKGINVDFSPWELPPEFITYGNNFRVSSGAIKNNGGEVLWSTAPTAFNPGLVFYAGSTSSDYWIVLGRNKVYGFDGTTWSDITSTAGYAALGTDDITVQFHNAPRTSQLV